jgi:hypothetical protein
MLQGWRHKVLATLLYHDCIGLVGTTLQQVWWYQQGCYKLLTACSKLVDNLGQAVRRQLVDGLLADLLQHLVTSLATSHQQVVFALLVTSCQQFCNNLLSLTTCNDLAEIIRLVTRLFWQVRYTRKNAQVVPGLQTSCYKSVHKLSTSCVRTACSQLLQQDCNKLLTNWNTLDGVIRLVTKLC